jgi:hypothetical protein
VFAAASSLRSDAAELVVDDKLAVKPRGVVAAKVVHAVAVTVAVA